MGLLVKPFIGVIFNGGALWLLTLLIADIQYTGGFKFFMWGGLVLGLINFFIKPLMKLFSLPAIVLTGGLFLIVINIGVLWFLQYFLSVMEFRDVTLAFPNFSTYVIGAVVFGVINWTLNLIIK